MNEEQFFKYLNFLIFFNWPIFIAFVTYSWGRGVCLQGQRFLFLFFLTFFSVALPLGGASIIISENPDAFGVLECPHLYWARKLFNFVPCKLIMI